MGSANEFGDGNLKPGDELRSNNRWMFLFGIVWQEKGLEGSLTPPPTTISRSLSLSLPSLHNYLLFTLSTFSPLQIHTSPTPSYPSILSFPPYSPNIFLLSFFILLNYLTMSSISWDDLLLPSRQASHPPCRRSLSARSLWMCTENLGCETGVIDYHSTSSEDNDECQHLREYGSFSPVRMTGLLANYSRAKAEFSRRSYPPPLTSMDRIKVKASREDGRLLIRAVPSYTSMHVERSDGRLLIRLVNTAPAAPSSLFESEQDQHYVEKDVHAEGSTHIEDDEEEGEEMEEEDDEHEEETMFVQYESGDRQNACGSCEMINGEREMGDVTDQKFQRPTRCKEAGTEHEDKGLLSWGTFCVASS